MDSLVQLTIKIRNSVRQCIHQQKVTVTVTRVARFLATKYGRVLSIRDVRQDNMMLFHVYVFVCSGL